MLINNCLQFKASSFLFKMRFLRVHNKIIRKSVYELVKVSIILQYSCLENPMDREAWWAAVHGVANSWTPPAGTCSWLRVSGQRSLSRLLARSFCGRAGCRSFRDVLRPRRPACFPSDLWDSHGHSLPWGPSRSTVRRLCWGWSAAGPQATRTETPAPPLPGAPGADRAQVLELRVPHPVLTQAPVPPQVVPAPEPCSWKTPVPETNKAKGSRRPAADMPVCWLPPGAAWVGRFGPKGRVHIASLPVSGRRRVQGGGAG